VIEDALIELLTPLVRRVIREELAQQATKKGWVTPKKAAEILGLSVAVVYQRARRGKLPARHVGRNLYIDLDALDATLGGTST
jgi:excisionase family DNA binding protein